MRLDSRQQAYSVYRTKESVVFVHEYLDGHGGGIEARSLFEVPRWAFELLREAVTQMHSVEDGCDNGS